MIRYISKCLHLVGITFSAILAFAATLVFSAALTSKAHASTQQDILSCTITKVAEDKSLTSRVSESTVNFINSQANAELIYNNGIKIASVSFERQSSEKIKYHMEFLIGGIRSSTNGVSSSSIQTLSQEFPTKNEGIVTLTLSCSQATI